MPKKLVIFLLVLVASPIIGFVAVEKCQDFVGLDIKMDETFVKEGNLIFFRFDLRNEGYREGEYRLLINYGDDIKLSSTSVRIEKSENMEYEFRKGDINILGTLEKDKHDHIIIVIDNAYLNASSFDYDLLEWGTKYFWLGKITGYNWKSGGRYYTNGSHEEHDHSDMNIWF